MGPLVGVLAVALALSTLPSLVSLPGVESAPASAAAAAEGDDVADVPSNPLGHVPARVDPADASVSLPNDAAQVPTDDAGVVVPGSDWTTVPGLPVTVRTDADAVVPSVSRSQDDSAPGVVTVALTDPTPSESPSATASEDPSASPSVPGQPDSSEVPVEVALVRPDQLSEAVMLLSFTAASDTGTLQSPGSTPSTTAASPTAETSPSASPTGEPSVTEPSGEPSASTSPTQSPSEEPTSPSGSAALDGSSVTGLDVQVSYGNFDLAFGGAWSDRLEVTAYPACYA
jgi:hypothetical protein